MFNRNWVLATLMTISSVHAWMIPIKTTVKNNSDQNINIFSQASGPVVDRYSGQEGWCYDNWTVLNLEPGSEVDVDFWIFREEQSKLKVSVLYSGDEEVSAEEEILTKYFRSDSLYAGDVTFYRISDANGLKTVHAGNLNCTVTGSGDTFSAQLVVF